jgi:hypothetical protein
VLFSRRNWLHYAHIPVALGDGATEAVRLVSREEDHSTDRADLDLVVDWRGHTATVATFRTERSFPWYVFVVPRGRLPLPQGRAQSVMVRLRMRPDAALALNLKAADRGMSRSEAIREALEEWTGKENDGERH